MNFSPNKTPIETIKEGAFRGTYFRGISSRGLIKYILMVGFSCILGIGQVEDWKMIKDKLIDGKKLWVGLGVTWWKWLEILVVNLIIQFRLKLDILLHFIELWINRRRLF